MVGWDFSTRITLLTSPYPSGLGHENKWERVRDDEVEKSKVLKPRIILGSGP